MSNFNLVVLVGRLTRDVEMRYTPNGSAVAKVGLAVNRKWKSESGEQKESTAFVDCTAWGKTAEVMSKYLKKGSPILVSGRLESESWTDKTTNEKRSKLGVVLESFQFMDSGGGKSEPAPKTEAPKAEQPDLAGDDSGVPF